MDVRQALILDFLHDCNGDENDINLVIASKSTLSHPGSCVNKKKSTCTFRVLFVVVSIRHALRGINPSQVSSVCRADRASMAGKTGWSSARLIALPVHGELPLLGQCKHAHVELRI